jgi:exosortase A
VKVDSARVLLPDSRTRWWAHRGVLAGAVTIAALVWLMGWYGDTVASMTAIWRRSETFAHGFLILPVSAWLVWRKRRELSAIPLTPNLSGAAWLGCLGFVWLLARLAEVLVVQQLALVAMVAGVVLTLLGRQVLLTLAFPLGFLFFAVPIGEGLIPPMMEFTADFTVWALRLTGIAVYREGTFFSIPSGDWSIVEGCSGLRYLIASFAGGCLYAYLTYRSWVRRCVFIAAAIVVPIIANWLRAYIIVMLGHLSGMRLALGVDHLIYGWAFFGLVMMGMLWVGSFWRESDDNPAGARVALPTPVDDAPQGRLLIAVLLAVVATGGWPLYAAHLETRVRVAPAVRLQVPVERNGWQVDPEPLTDWRPRFKGTDASVFQVYRRGDQRVVLYLGLYRQQRQGAELINSQNIMVVQKHPVWSNVGEGRRSEQLGRYEVPVRETRLRSAKQRLLIWDWLYIDGRHLSNPYLGKLLLAAEKLVGSPDDGVAIIVATPTEEHTTQAEAALQAFVQDMLPAVEASLNDSAGGR